MLDDELLQAMKKEVPTNIHSVFISAITNKGIKELKDLIWKTLHEIGD
jgi:GTP-binding protein